MRNYIAISSTPTGIVPTDCHFLAIYNRSMNPTIKIQTIHHGDRWWDLKQTELSFEVDKVAVATSVKNNMYMKQPYGVLVNITTNPGGRFDVVYREEYSAEGERSKA